MNKTVETNVIDRDIESNIFRVQTMTEIEMNKNQNNIWFRDSNLKSFDDITQVGKTIEFKDIVYAVFQGRGMQPKCLLKSISGTFKSGELVALMGPSGAGKSTLMNVLAGFKTRNTSGQVLVNSKPRNLKLFRRASCFIMQDAPLLPQLTVEEAMICSSRLNLPEKIAKEDRSKIIDEILVTFGLIEAKKTRTSELSGGQRKRLSIAQEMINNPPIMFFDEPTSGLDSASSIQCIAALQTIARQGRTVVCTIHQPSAKVFDMFDQLYFLCAGQCIYRGPVKYLVPYLNSQNLSCPRYHNPSDYLMDIASAESGDDLRRLICCVNNGNLDRELERIFMTLPIPLLQKSNDVDPMQSTANILHLSSLNFIKNENNGHSFDVGLISQVQVLIFRTFICIWRDTTLTRLRLLVHILVGILIGLLYFNIGNQGFQVINNAAFIFFSVLFIMFSSLMPTVMTFPLEMRVFLTENLNYWYSVKAYYIAKTCADLPFQIVFPLIYGFITYWMTDQPADFHRFMIFITVIVQTGLVGQALGLVIGAATELEVAVFLGPATGIPILLFSGFFVTLDAIPKYLQWLSYSSFTRYAFEGAMKGIYANNRTDLDCTKKPSTLTPIPCMKKAESVLTLLSISDYDFFIDFMVLNVFFVFLRVLCFFVLYVRCKNGI